jgi:hypothetical protein
MEEHNKGLELAIALLDKMKQNPHQFGWTWVRSCLTARWLHRTAGTALRASHKIVCGWAELTQAAATIARKLSEVVCLIARPRERAALKRAE